MRWYSPYWQPSFLDWQESEQQEQERQVLDLLRQRRQSRGRLRPLPHQRRAFLRALHRRLEQRHRLQLESEQEQERQQVADSLQEPLLL